jgi:hypothetical protein
MTIDDLVRANRLLEQDFEVLTSQLTKYKDHKNSLNSRLEHRLTSQEALIEDITQVLDYIA